MATNGQDSKGPAETDSRATYERFMSITKWAVIGISVALILMALLLV